MPYLVLRNGAVSVVMMALCACSDSGATTDTPTPIASGDVFATMMDGAVLANDAFDTDAVVHLAGGKRPGSTGSGLPAGDYYFQVTDPSGLTLLSTDDIECRRVRVNGSGVFDQAYPGPGCQHTTGTMAEQASVGGITIHLQPFAQTPSSTGGHRVWFTAVDAYDPAHKDSHGFVDAASLNATFQVIAKVDTAVCGNGVRENTEQCDDGNTVGEDGCAADCSVEAQN